MNPGMIPVRQKPVAFEVIKSNIVAEVSSKVTEMLKAGWVPHGDMKVVDGGTCYQAMIKIELEEFGGSSLAIPRPILG